MKRQSGPGTQAIYEIVVQGALSGDWANWLSGMTFAVQAGPQGQPVTVFTGTVPDQAALRGILGKLWDMNLVLISVQRIQGEERP
jgi:hypothetical protein